MVVDVTHIPVDQAAQVLGMDVAILRHLLDAGIVHGTCRCLNLDEATEIAEQIKASRAPVQGNGISIAHASDLYSFSKQSIYKWISDSWVRVVQQKPMLLVNQADMATARVLADLLGHRPGRAVFPAKPRSGRPRKQ